jgi:hypothetical protein
MSNCNKGKPQTKFQQQLHDKNINAALDQLIEAKSQNNGWLPHRVMAQVNADLKFAGIVADRAKLNYCLPKRDREKRKLEELNKIGCDLPSLIDIDQSTTA